MDDGLRERALRKVRELFPSAQGWRVLSVRAPKGLGSPSFIASRGRQVVVGDIAPGSPTLEDIRRLDMLREAFLATDALLIYTGELDDEVRRESLRLGVRLLSLA